MNWNFSILRAARSIARNSVVASTVLIGAGALASSDNDPILGQYSGDAFLHIQAFVAGIRGVFQELPQTAEIELEFDPGNDAFIKVGVSESRPGTWKKNGARYSANFSESETETLRLQSEDSNAKASFKLLKIFRGQIDGLGGKYQLKRKYRSENLRFRQNDIGVFGCRPAA